MRFVDQLNSMPSEEPINNRRLNQQFIKDLNGIHGSIQGACIAQRSRRYVEGYIVRTYDDEYNQYGFRYLHSVTTDNSGRLSSRLYSPTKGEKYSASLVSDEYHQKREGLKPISKEHDSCQKYISNLRPLLKTDGFEVLCLESFACYDEYDLVKYSGFFNPKPILERHNSNVLLGYAIRFVVRW